MTTTTTTNNGKGQTTTPTTTTGKAERVTTGKLSRRTAKATANRACNDASKWLNAGIINAGLKRVDKVQVKVAMSAMTKRRDGKTIFGRNGAIELTATAPVSGIVDSWLYSACTGKADIDVYAVELLIDTLFEAMNNTTHKRYHELSPTGKVCATYTQAINSLNEITKGRDGKYQGKYMHSMGYNPNAIDRLTDTISPLCMVVRAGLMTARKAIKAADKAQ